MTMPSIPISDEDREIAASWCVRLADGPLSSEAHDAFRAWLAAHPAHPELFERSFTAWQAVSDQAHQPEMLWMRGQALQGFRSANRRRWASPMLGWRKIAAAAACLVLLLGTTLWWYYAPTTYQTAVGERRVIALADGSEISLDASSRVDVRYLGGRRELWLREGRAMFTVAKDPIRPFSVEADNRLVVATGTRFSVERVDGQMRVALFEGHVAVTEVPGHGRRPVPIRLANGTGSASDALIPGRELVVAGSAPVAEVEAIDPGEAAGWEAGLLQFSEEPLALAVQRMSRYSTLKLTVSRSAAQIPISGQFRAGDIDAFIEGVTALFPVATERNSRGDILFRQKLANDNRKGA